jgi:hypothetical protein
VLGRGAAPSPGDAAAAPRDPDLAVLRSAARSQQSLNRRRAPRKDSL